MAAFTTPLITDFRQTPQGDLIALTNPDGAQCRMYRPPLYDTRTASYAALYAAVTNPCYVAPDGDDTKDGSTLPKRVATIGRAAALIDAGTAGWIVLCASDDGSGTYDGKGYAKFRQGVKKTSGASFGSGSKVIGMAALPGCFPWIDARDVFTGWTFVSGKGWSHSYTPPFDVAIDPHAPRKLTNAITATATSMRASKDMGPLKYGQGSSLPRLVQLGSEWAATTSETNSSGGLSDYTIVRGVRGTSPNAHAAGATIGQSMPPQDQLFVDGVPYVLNDTDDAGPGEFSVDEVANKIYIGEAAGWDPTAHTIEVGMRGIAQFNNASFAKNGFKQYGIGYIGWAGTPNNDGGAPMQLGDNNVMKQCVIAYAPWLACGINGDSTNFDQVVFHSAGMGVHGTGTNGNTFTNVRVHHTNWNMKLDVSPTDVARFAGSKNAVSNHWLWDFVLFDLCMANGLWHDVRCKNTTIQNSAFTDCLGYGYTQEVGDTQDIIGCFFARCGRDHGDNFRLSGVGHGRIVNNLSLDSWGYAFGLYEDRRTYPQNSTPNTITDAQRYHSHFMGDTFDTLVKNNVLVVVNTTTGGKSPGTDPAWGGANGNGNGSLVKPDGSPNTANEKDSLGFAQDAAFSTKQMLASDPWAGTLDGQSDYNVIINLTSPTVKNYKWCTPADMYWGPDHDGSGSPTATTTYDLAGVKAASVNEDHSIEIRQVATGTKKILADYFPNLTSQGDGRWTGGTIPTDGSTNSGATIPGDIADVLGVAGSGARVARFGPYKYPIPTALVTGTIIGSQVSTQSTVFPGPSTIHGTQVATRSIAIQGGGPSNVTIVGSQATSIDTVIAGAVVTTTNLPPAVAWDNSATPANNSNVQGIITFTVTATDDHGFAVNGVELWAGDSVADLVPTGLFFTQRDADTWDLSYDTHDLPSGVTWVFRANGTDNGTPPLSSHSFARNLTIINPIFGSQVITQSFALGQPGIVYGAQVTSRSIAIQGGDTTVILGSRVVTPSTVFAGSVRTAPNTSEPPVFQSVSLNAGDSIGTATVVLADISDDHGIDHVVMRITKPDGTTVDVPMT